MANSSEQSAVLNIAPESTLNIEEKLTTKNAMSTVLNRVKALEQKAENLRDEAKFLRTTLEEFLNE